MGTILNENLIYEILSVVEEIPPGKVATYGRLLGSSEERKTQGLWAVS